MPKLPAVPRILLRATLAGIAVVAAVWAGTRLQPIPAHWSDVPPAASAPTLIRVLDRDGLPVAVMRRAEHPFIPASLDQIDPLLIEATLAAEDRRFFSHPGIDPAAIVRAAWQNMRSRRLISGGSTLTQQLVSLLDEHAQGRGTHDGDSRTASWRHKLRTAWIALALETRWSKEEILEAYFNLASYGTDLRGVRAACRTYFAHDPDIVTLEEAALLAALPQSPARLDPRRRPENARTARNRVLQRMGIDPEAREQARARSLGLAATWSAPGASIAPHWTARLVQLPPDVCEVRLPLDGALQMKATSALHEVLMDLEELGADAGGVTAIHNSSGEVRAWVGSPDWGHPGHGQVDGTLALRQPGSALKPFAYALAFERGLRPSSILADLPTSHPGADGIFRPRNYSGSHNGPVRARMALANSWNAPAVALLANLGAGELLAALRDVGLESLERRADEYGLGLILGVGEVRLADLTNAYACLARGGIYYPRVEIIEARDAAGRLVSGPGPMTAPAGALAGIQDHDSRAALRPRRVFDPDACFIIASILSDEEARAPEFGRSDLLSFPYPAAVKTGTSSDWRDNWAFGFTEDWTVGVWVGAAGGGSMDRVSGTAGALRVMRRVLDYAHSTVPTTAVHDDPVAAMPGRFPAPDGFERRRICALSGMRARPQCPDQILEWSLKDDPQDLVCDWHRMVEIDAASGLLARPCTPADRVREVPFVRSGSAGAYGGPPGLFASWFLEQGRPSPPLDPTPCICMEIGCRAVQDGLDAHLSDTGRHRANTRTSGTHADQDDAWAHPRAFCRIHNPVDGSIYYIDPSLPAAQQAIALEGACAGEEQVWLINGEVYARSAHGGTVFWPLSPGRHEIVLRSSGPDGPELEDAVRIVVEDDE